MSKNIALLALLLLGLFSCSTEEDCPLENIGGTYTGTFNEKYPFEDQADTEAVESIDVTIANINGDAAELTLHIDGEPQVLDIFADGCNFTSEFLIEESFYSYQIEGSFENDQLYFEINNPLKVPSTQEDYYSGLEALEDSGSLVGMSGLELLKVLNDLDGFSGFEALEDVEGIEGANALQVLELIMEIVEYFVESITIDFTKI